MTARNIAALAGTYGLAMVLGAVFFQYVVGVPPCEMCFWQRYPHIAAAIFGLIGAATFKGKGMEYAAGLALAALAVTGLIGAYHSGVEWRIFPGPTSCTGDRVTITAGMNLNAAPVVRCDIVSWRLFGLFSLANLNAVFSLSLAGVGGALLVKPTLLTRLVAKQH